VDSTRASSSGVSERAQRLDRMASLMVGMAEAPAENGDAAENCDAMKIVARRTPVDKSAWDWARGLRSAT